MAWEEIAAPIKTTPSHKAAVEFTIGKLPGGRAIVATIVMRAKYIGSPSWLRPPSAVRLLRGTGENAGILRIVPHGDLVIMASGGRHGSAALIRFSLWAGMPTECRRASVAFRLSDDCLEIDLPAWACRTAPANGVKPPAAAVRSAMIGKPNETAPGAFSMLGGRVPSAGRAS